MNRLRHLLSPTSIGLVLSMGTLFWAGYLLAHASGEYGCVQTGCDCHNASPDASGAATVSVTGPQLVAPGSTNTYTVTITGGPSGTHGGFNVKASGGTLVAGTGTKVSGSEIVHSSSSSRSWTFQWTAPSTTGTHTFLAVAMATNGSGSGGDSWDWYGGASSNPFMIQVDSAVPTRTSSWGQVKARYR